jgi:hypothetical protein
MLRILSEDTGMVKSFATRSLASNILTATISTRRIALIAIALILATTPVLALTNMAHASTTKIERELVYANGQTFTMLVNPSAVDGSSPGTSKTAEPLYLLAFPLNPSGTGTSPITLPSGYQPQCNPCYHPGVPLFLAYHDHVLEGSPGFGTSGTAGSFSPIWHAFVLVYNPTYANSPGFKPVKADEDISAAIAAGDFLNLTGMGPTVAGNPFEIDSGITFLCITLPS